MVFTIIIYIILATKEDLEIYPIVIIINIVITLFHLLSLIIHIILIESFLIKIYQYFEENKNSFIFDLYLAIINIIFFIEYIYFSNSCCQENKETLKIIKYNNL